MSKECFSSSGEEEVEGLHCLLLAVGLQDPVWVPALARGLGC